MNFSGRILSAALGGRALLVAGLCSFPLTARACGQMPGNVLLPQPVSLTRGAGELPLKDQFAVMIEGPHSDRLDRAVSRMLKQMQTRTGNASIPDQLVSTGRPRVKIKVKGEGAAVQSVREDESYQLEITPGGVDIEAATVPGAMHGLQTMLQLIQTGGTGYVLPFVTIRDSPRFAWRGLMVDCGRHFEPLDVLKRTLDGMAAVKLNVFHWHLTEDQGFRIESKKFPALIGRGSAGLFYTQADARELVAYARDRGIRVVPEFEMPGHSTAWLVAYPELASGKPPTQIRTEFGISSSAIDPTREETYRFLQTFLTEMASIFPDEFVHIGGDETPAPDWKSNPRIRQFMHLHGLKDSPALQAYFNQRVAAILAGLNKRMVGWDEILNPALPKNALVQSWRGKGSLEAGAKLGYQGILSAPYYLDRMLTAGQHYGSDPAPPDAGLTAAETRLILGGEICMWGEHVDEQSIDSRIWPRAAAIAERFWSPAEVKDVGDMYRRLDATSLELESLGLTHISHEDKALRALAGSEQVDALRVFASVFEPVSFSDRYRQQKTSQTTALDSFVDAVRPDPPLRREFEQRTQAFLADPRGDTEDAASLLVRFHQITASLPAVREQIATSPRLRDMTTRASQLGELAQTGAEAVTFLSSGTKAPAGWKAARLSLLTAAKAPSGIVQFTFVDSLSQLIAAVQD